MSEHSRSGGPRRRLILALATLALCVQGACGFKLRESAELPFRTIYNDLRPGSELAAEFNRQARIAVGTTLSANRGDAQAAVELVTEKREREAVSFSPSGRPREYLLRYIVSFKVRDSTGVELLEPTEIVLRRYITTTDVEVLSAQLEEDFLYDEMRSDMVEQILRRLAVVQPVT